LRGYRWHHEGKIFLRGFPPDLSHQIELSLNLVSYFEGALVIVHPIGEEVIRIFTTISESKGYLSEVEEKRCG
jgi:hypothetical protein